MPTRRLARTNRQRYIAIKAGKDRKDMVPAPLVIPYTAGTDTWIDNFIGPYKVKIDAVDAALLGQVTASNLVKSTHRLALLHILHFYEALQNAILRGTFTKEIRVGYGLAESDAHLPTVKTEADIEYWGDKLNTGETARVAAGGAPITFPSLAQVNTAVANFHNANLLQANAKEIYDVAQEQVAAMNPEADMLILKMWNETETAFDTGDKPSMRRKSREWGVIYVALPGEVPSADDFSIMGKARVEGPGSTAGIDDVQITVIETNTVVLSEGNGDYLVPLQPQGSYTLLVEKPGFVSKTINGVQVVAGIITQLDIQLTPTGGISGQVLQGGSPVASLVEVLGTGLTAIPDGLGNYFRNDIPVGQQTVRATITGSNPPLFIDHIVTVSAGGVLEVVFNFP